MKAKLHPSLKNTEFTLDDIIFPPLKIPNFEWSDVDLSTKLTKNITLKMPLVSAPMDTVTEHKMAILLALFGGIGVIHYNFSTIEDQIKEVEKVRRFEAGFVKNPVVLSKNNTVGDVFQKEEETGFLSYPITEDGTLDSPMVGIITRHDIRYQEDLDKKLEAVMTPKDKLIVADKKKTLDKNDIKAANLILRTNNIDILPIVDGKFHVVALVTDRDLSLDKRYPLATKDGNKQLKVLVAVESRLKLAQERIIRAKEAGASGVVIDARNIFGDHLEIAKWVKQNAPGLDVILGNVVSADVVTLVMKQAGKYIDGFRVGIGGGEVCTTTESLGIGRSLANAIFEVDQALKVYRKKFGHLGIIADGGIKSPHHIVGALMLGANAVMMGSMLAGLDESPIRAEYDPARGYMVKTVRGMGSAEVMRERAGSNRYMVSNISPTERFPEGIKKVVAYKGSGADYLKMLFAGVRQAMHGLGHKNLLELYRDGYIIPAQRASSKGSL
ncbi:IMP dehydrogenase [Candidatus Daviesbacteria bacterium]|nr:IMP dehydrogenase [Candidatus Daviesbacteria bacterium]